MSVEQVEADNLYVAAAELFAEQLCPDCPVRNWLGQGELEGIGAEPSEEAQVDIAVNQANILGAAAAAVMVRKRAGCEGQQESDHVCEGCGNHGICPALTAFNEAIEVEE